MCHKYHHIIWVLFLTVLSLNGQEMTIVADTQNIVFDLGEVQVFGEKTHPFTLTISNAELLGNPKRDVSQALALLPGINFVQFGQKNDAMVNVRGFDLRQVPVYIDGVPVYVSYDGYVDLGRFLVSDLAQISVTRGETSLLLGPNALGGAINLVSRKPVSRFEMDAASGVTFDRLGYGGLQSELNVGSRKEKYYYQLGLAFIDSKAFALSGKSDPGQSSGELQYNSQQRDLNSSMKVGFTPNETDSYVFSYHFQDGSKGVPAYAGEDPNQRVRYWQFPTIRKQGIHFNSKTALNREAYVQTRLFYDDYFSDLRSYDDSTFTSQKSRSSFTSIYDDETIGGSLILSWKPAVKHEMKTALHSIYDHHREYNIFPMEEPIRHFKDVTFSIGWEDQYSISESLHVQFGIGYHLKNSLEADNYDPQTDSIFPFPEHKDQSFNLLTGIIYNVGKNHTLGTNLSRKNRFPTMKDRYSYRLGQSLPNPDLVSEESWNVDLSYAYILGTAFQVKAALFFSQLQNTIQAVYGVDPGSSAVYQYQNTGDARFYGLEADLAWSPISEMKTGLQYTLTEQKNLSNPELLFTNVPGHKIFGFVNYTFFSRLLIKLTGMYNSSRFSSSDGLYGSDSFFRMDLATALTIYRTLSIEASLTNILDAEYSYVEGYPAPGRQVHLGIRFSFR